MKKLKSPYSAEEGRKEGGGGKRRAPNKAGPMRPPILIGIKWTIGTLYRLKHI